MIHREGPDAQKGGADRRSGLLGQVEQRLFRMTEDDAVPGQDDRPLRLGDGGRSEPGLIELDMAVQLVAGDVDALAGWALCLCHLHVLADVDQDGAGTAGGGDVEGLMDDARQLGDVRDEVAVLGDGARGADHVRLLEGVAPDLGAVHLAGDRDHRHRVHVGGAQAGDQV